MCDLNCVNLIDLNLEDEVPCSVAQVKIESGAKLVADTPHFILSSWRKSDSLENNPFDGVQTLADRIDDPFDIVEKEACLKAHQVCKEQAEVKLGNLLSLSDDNLINQYKMPARSLVSEELRNLEVKQLDLESPPVVLIEKQLPDSKSGPDTDSTPNSSAETSNSAKLRKSMEYRKRLLKLSISNSAFSSPTVLKQSLEFEDILGTPVSSMFSRAAEFGEHSLAAESPLKLVGDEDLISEKPLNFIDSEKNFEADLEMLKIPILNNLPSPPLEHISIQSENSLIEVHKSPDRLENAVPNLEDIKAKLKAKRDENTNNHQLEISSLIQNLKTLISSGEMVDNKKQQVSDLLESLSLALKPSNMQGILKTSEMLDVPPQPIKRQGTFDMDLLEKLEPNTDNHPLVQDMPNCMISSSATYDGETPNEKQDINLPEIAPLSPQSSPSQNCYSNTNGKDCANHLQTDVNDIMEQLSKLLINNSADCQTNCSNPTFIVVMNTSQLNHSNQNAVEAKLTNYLENSVNYDSPDLTKVNSMTRQRSQSLSIHDKIKIVHIPLQPPTPSSIQKKHRAQLDESPPITTTPPSGKEMPEFKTPARLRRNSYSSGTPYTAQVGVRRTGFGSESKHPTKIQRAQTLDTHHEGQQQAIVRPMSMLSNNLLTFKPDLKKKFKHSTESIMKSSGPLKATIPVKKVAPMLKTSPPTPEKNTKSKINMLTTPLREKGSSTLSEGVGYPKACSTPAAFTSPLKRTTGPVNKPRYSHMSATPNPKSSATNSFTSASLKRRSIAEFKTKSPFKPRASNLGLAAPAATSRASAGSSRLSVSAGPRISKTPVKTITVNTTTVKPVSRLSSRASIGGSLLSIRNKENKRP